MMPRSRSARPIATARSACSATSRRPASFRQSRSAATAMAARCSQGIPTAQYSPKPTHRQTAYRDYPLADGGLPVTDRLADEVISLPMHAYLDEATQDRIVAAVRGALGK